MSDDTETWVAETTASALASERAVLSAALYSTGSMAEARRLLSDEDFWAPVHADLWRVMRTLHAAGTIAEPRAVYAEAAKMSAEHVRVLVDLGTQGLPFGTVDHHAQLIVQAATLRNLQQTLRRGWQMATGIDPEPVGIAETVIEQLRVTQRMQAPPATAIDFLDLVRRRQEPVDWVIPGLLARANRLILTAPEGYGKSTLLRQIACCTAAGLHPFRAEGVEPKRVYVLDAENPADINTEEYGQIYDHLEEIGQLPKRGMLVVDERGPLIDLLNPREAADVFNRIEQLKPDLITIGPLYKLFDENPNDEGPARKLASALDRMRAISGAALITEAHSPHSDGPQGQLYRPFGASLWKRWPEFGYCLHPVPVSKGMGPEEKKLAAKMRESKLTPWRGARARGREWPLNLSAGGRLPWEETRMTAHPAVAFAGSPRYSD